MKKITTEPLENDDLNTEPKLVTDELHIQKNMFWQLIRVQNLIIIGVTVIVFALVQAQYHIEELLLFKLGMLLASCILVAAAGYIINDIYDVETDKVNKPEKVFIDKSISRIKAWFAYSIMSALGVIFGFLVSYQMGFIAITIVLMLYFYSADLKKTVLRGNLLIAFLSASVVFSSSQAVTDPDPLLLIFYTFFAFFVSFKRELIKDAQDLEGDTLTGAVTFPVKYQFKKTVALGLLISFILSVIMLLAVTQQTIYKEIYLYYMLALVVAPLFICDIWLWIKPNKGNFKSVSLVLKLIMIAGLLSVFLYSNQ